MRRDYDVFGLGAITLDFIGRLDHWPTPGDKEKLSDLIIAGGGLTGTAMATVAALGGRAAIAGKLGFSVAAEKAMQLLQEAGVDTGNIIRVTDSEPVISFIISDTKTGERTILFSRKNVSYPGPEEFPDRYWYKGTRVLFIDHGTGEAGIKAAEIAKSNGIPVVMDAERDEPGLPKMIRLADHLILGKTFGRNITGKESDQDILVSLKRNDDKVIIITKGSEGLSGTDGQGFFTQPAFRVHTVDTTGSGDVFHGAYALGIARGWRVRDCCSYARAAAAISTTKQGGRNGIPDDAAVQELFKSENIKIPG